MTDRLAFRPLEELIARRWPDPNPIRQDCATAMNVPAAAAWIADVIGVDRHVVLRYRGDGVTVYEADEIGIGLGIHPSCVWPDWWTADDPVRQLQFELRAS